MIFEKTIKKAIVAGFKEILGSKDVKTEVLDKKRELEEVENKLKNTKIALQDLKNDVATQKHKKTMEDERVAHLSKIDNERREVAFEKKSLKQQQEFAEKEMKLLKENQKEFVKMLNESKKDLQNTFKAMMESVNIGIGNMGKGKD